jgi:Major Facilitator Superfamily
MQRMDVSPRRLLAAAQLANSIGDGAYLVCSALYFTHVVGLSAAQVGLGLTVAWGVGFLAGVPLGHLADRRGPRGVAALLALGTAAAVVAFLAVRSFLPFLVAACLYACFQSGLAAARQALLAGLVPARQRTRVRAHLQSTLNAGLALGAAAGGLALYADTRTAYLAVLGLDAASFLLAAVLLRRLPAVPAAPPVAAGPALSVLRDRPFALVSFLNMVMLLYMPMLSLVAPLWIVERTAAPRWTVSGLLVVNTLSVVAFQVRVARRVTGLRSASRSFRHAGVVMLGACAVFALSATGSSAWVAAGVLLAGVGLQVLAEMMLAAGAWELSFTLAPPDKQGQYQGFFGGGTAVARMLGPLLVTTLVIGWGPAGWLALGGLFLAAGLSIGPAVRWADRSRPGTGDRTLSGGSRVPPPRRTGRRASSVCGAL